MVNRFCTLASGLRPKSSLSKQLFLNADQSGVKAPLLTLTRQVIDKRKLLDYLLCLKIHQNEISTIFGRGRPPPSKLSYMYHFARPIVKSVQCDAGI